MALVNAVARRSSIPRFLFWCHIGSTRRAVRDSEPRESWEIYGPSAGVWVYICTSVSSGVVYIGIISLCIIEAWYLSPSFPRVAVVIAHRPPTRRLHSYVHTHTHARTHTKLIFHIHIYRRHVVQRGGRPLRRRSNWVKQHQRIPALSHTCTISIYRSSSILFLCHPRCTIQSPIFKKYIFK